MLEYMPLCAMERLLLDLLDLSLVESIIFDNNIWITTSTAHNLCLGLVITGEGLSFLGLSLSFIVFRIVKRI